MFYKYLSVASVSLCLLVCALLFRGFMPASPTVIL